MENKKFDIPVSNIYYGVDKNNNITLYIMNNKRTVVRTIDEFIARQGGIEVIDVSARTVKKGEEEIISKYDNLIKNVKGPKFLGSYRRQVEELKAKQEKEINEYMTKYKELLHSPNLKVKRGFSSVYFENMEYNNSFRTPDYIAEGKERINLIEARYHLNEDGYTYGVVADVNEFKKLEADLQEKVKKEIQTRRDVEEMKQNTEEYLNY